MSSNPIDTSSRAVVRLELVSELARYLEPALVPIAGALWLWNLYVLIT